MTPVELRSAGFLVSFRSDDRTRFFTNPKEPDRITVVDAVLDILPLEKP
jgi:hypothetical protein